MMTVLAKQSARLEEGLEAFSGEVVPEAQPTVRRQECHVSNPRRITDHRGFSLIELMVTVAIIGILSATAVPTYGKMRQRFFNAMALSDVANAGRALEGMDSTASFSVTVVGPGLIKQLPGPRVSKGVTLVVTRTRAANGKVTYRVTGKHKSGTGATFIFTGGKVYATGAKL